MNEIRKELERQFAAHGLLPEENADSGTEKTAGNADAALSGDKIVIQIEAPAGYSREFAEDFKNLSPEWQEYLGKREKEISGKLEELSRKIDGYKWLDDIYAASKKRLDSEGVASAHDWLTGLAGIDEKMCEDPLKTILCLAGFYGVDLNAAKSGHEADKCGEILQSVSRMEQQFRLLVNALAQRNAEDFENRLKAYGEECDAYGRPLHPYFYQVLPQIRKLLHCGVTGDIDEAYAKALWMDSGIREKLVLQKINLKAAEAENARKAAFSPKGKTKAPERKLTLREELEKNMAAFSD